MRIVPNSSVEMVSMIGAPEKGEDIRARICSLMRRKGIRISDAEVDELVAELARAEE